MDRQRMLHIVTVHYKCEEELRNSLLSVEQVFSSSSKVRNIKVWVIDNGRNPGRDLRDPPLPTAPEIIEPGENIGFGRACNLALRNINHGVVLFLNPDTRLLPGSLDAFVEPLEDKKIGGVGAMFFLDDDLEFTVSRPIENHLILHARNLLKKGLPFLGIEKREVISRKKFMTTKEPVPAKMLCGASMAIPKPVLDEAGFFDESFFMYGEDMDLVYRIRKKGYKLVHNPRARVVHYYDRSARQEEERKEEWIRQSYGLFMRIHYPWALRKTMGLATSILSKLLPLEEWKGLRLVQAKDNPRIIEPEIRPEWPSPWLFEFSEGPFYDITACKLVDDERIEIPEAIWQGLVPKTYWTRLSCPGSKGPIFHGEMKKE